MDRRERRSSLVTALLAFQDGMQSDLWTALPAVLMDRPSEDGEGEGDPCFDPEKRTVQVQPLIQAKVQAQDGSFSWVTLPPLLDCPVMFPSGGGCTLTFPLKAGDECLVIIASRCIDAWWQNGGKKADDDPTPTPQVQAELRMHDLSDGFVFVGISSTPYVIPDISITTAQFRNDAGTAYVEIDPEGTFIHTRIEAEDDPDSHVDVRFTDVGDVTVDISNDATVHVGGDAVATIDGDATVTIGGDATVSVGGDGQVDVAGVLNMTGHPINLN